MHRDIGTGTPEWVLLLSDVHFDSAKCDRQMLDRHLRLAHERKAAIFVNGDWFDLMGGKYDPRNNLPGKDVMPQYRGSNYIDLVIDETVEYLKPYSHLLTVMAQGNHETSVKQRNHTDPLGRVVKLLKAHGSQVELGGYSGYVRWSYRRTKEKYSWMMHYHHGAGGNAKRSKGILSADIDSMQYPDADIIVRGHDHNKWYLPLSVERINSRMSRKDTRVHHIRCGSYKRLGDGYAGWETQKGFGRPTLGGWWLRHETIRKGWEMEVQEAC